MKRSIKSHMLLGLAVLLVLTMAGCATKTGKTAEAAPSVFLKEAELAETPSPATAEPGLEAAPEADAAAAKPAGTEGPEPAGPGVPGPEPAPEVGEGAAGAEVPGPEPAPEVGEGAAGAEVPGPEPAPEVGEGAAGAEVPGPEPAPEVGEGAAGPEVPGPEPAPEVGEGAAGAESPAEDGKADEAGKAGEASEGEGLPVVVLPIVGGGPGDETGDGAPETETAPQVGAGEAGAGAPEESPVSAMPPLDGVVARIPVRLDGNRISSQTKQTNLGNLICKAMSGKSGADFAVLTGGSIQGSLAKGDLAAADVEAVLAPDAQLTVVEINGAQIYELFGSSQRFWPEPFEGYLQTDLQIVSIPQEGGGRRILKLFLGGEPLYKNKVYRCAANDFLMDGGACGFRLPDLGNFELMGALAPILIQWLWENYPPEAGPAE